MNKFFSLMKVNILGLVRGKGNKKRKISHGLILLLAGTLIFYYAYKFANLSMKGLRFIHSEYIILPEFFAISSVLLIFINYKKINGLFFKSKDFDLLDAMPIKRSYIIISKMLELYISALMVTLVFMLPAYILYVKNVPTDMLFHIYYFISLVFVPLIPLFVATCIGYLISFVSTFFKRKDIVQLIASILVIVGAYYLGYNSVNMNSKDYANFGKVVLSFFDNYYPMTIYYKNIVIDNDIVSLLIFILINVGLISLITFIITRTFSYINSKLSQGYTSKNKKIKKSKKISKTGSLLKKDFKRLFSSTHYLLNTCVGVIIVVLMSFGLATSSKTGIFSEIILETKQAKYIISAIFVMFLGYIYPTSVSLSLEGKNFYILRVLPISFRDIVKEKDIFHMIISVPCALITLGAITYRLNVSIYLMILLFIYLLSSILFFSKIHLLLDMIFLNLSWEDEHKVIKRSMQSFLSIVAAISVFAIAALISLSSAFEVLLLDIGLVVLTILLHVLLVRFGTRKFNTVIN